MVVVQRQKLKTVIHLSSDISEINTNSNESSSDNESKASDSAVFILDRSLYSLFCNYINPYLHLKFVFSYLTTIK